MATQIKNSIKSASRVIGNTWPLYSFVTSNPLSGYEEMPFTEAVVHAKKDLGVKVFPDASIFSQAFSKDEMDKDILGRLLKENGFNETPEHYLKRIELLSEKEKTKEYSVLDVIMAKWLSSFMDEGLAEWQMPYKEKGFYTAWRQLAKYDNDLNIKNIAEIPKTSLKALESVLDDVSEDYYESIFRYHLSALPGWTGYINHRNTYDSPWQKSYPIDLQDYLAVRLWIAEHLNLDIYPKSTSPDNDTAELIKLQQLFLCAWEKRFQNRVVGLLQNQAKVEVINAVPDAQLVFCIDTRSELIRRHIEEKGNYETFGYAGFFGIAMDYKNPHDGIQRKSCPPILNSSYIVEDKPQNGKLDKFEANLKRAEHLKFTKYFRKRMKNMLPSTFGYVEGSGVFYGLSMVARTFFSNKIYDVKKRNQQDHEDLSETHMSSCEENSNGISIEEKVAIVKSGFDLMGWKNFAPLVVFTGHGGHSANNPFNSSLDCGACAASPGRHNARMLAKIANEELVRQHLLKDHGITIPNDTIFIGAEHNTTTDEIVIFDSQVPKSHQEALQKLKASLNSAQRSATEERLGVKNGVNLAKKKTSDWSETRPEWGLAKNAAFIIGSRDLTKTKNLDGRSFLHSYDWGKDETGNALEAIMQGPMVVTQWINNHYYFSTVDNDTFGSGSKITHNVTGNFGVVQGNGGDLKMGLPLQSLKSTDSEMYHQPLRLSVFIHAPLDRVQNIISKNANIKNLLDNEWIYLFVIDPTKENEISQYTEGFKWINDTQKTSTELKEEPREVFEDSMA
ncbi:DUF2309 domain-containing protein [Winogradskyella aquimaris]|uniref:Probable inorganic carbon transporter subunit DabA n=1 Tax=Winogradskyella aquimaris TaxID=864074 RepID=A0ABU5EN94_9FLAO|nr:DUF2309 domain-containing protein [Winogradskyella aquimaris]MDY2586157.1 DUF2309 domain-containing protein [Winogradskyella aquimaris]